MLSAQTNDTIRSFAVVAYVAFTIGLFVGATLATSQRAGIAIDTFETPCMKRARLAEEKLKARDKDMTDG